jgi:aryl carrier-like protein
MSIKSAIILQIQQIAGETEKDLPPLTDDLALLELGLDSLAIAILVTRNCPDLRGKLATLGTP